MRFKNLNFLFVVGSGSANIYALTQKYFAELLHVRKNTIVKKQLHTYKKLKLIFGE
jgi:hypothetical protein